MNKNQKKILYITELFPFPTNSGGKIKSLNTIQTLSKKFNITLICFSKNRISHQSTEYVKTFVKNCHVIILPNIDEAPNKHKFELIKNYIKLKPYFLYQFFSKSVLKKINKLILEINPEIIHIDHVNMAQYLPNKKNQKWILEEHNIEHELAWTKFINYKIFSKTKIHLLIEFFLIFLFEKQIYKKFDYIFAISNYDKKIIKEKFSNKNVTTQQLVYLDNYQKRNSKTKIITFVGDITWTPNKDAIKWFIIKIYPMILKKQPNTKLQIIGNVDCDFSKKYECESIIFHGFKEDIDEFLKQTNVFVLPFKSGAGVRIKALTAFSYKIPIVSTKLGMQGIEAQTPIDYLLSENEIEFAKNCLLLLSNQQINKKIGMNGQKYLQKFYNKNNNIKFLKDYLNVTQ